MSGGVTFLAGTGVRPNLELVGLIARAVADLDRLRRKVNRGNGEDAFLGCTQRLETVIPGTNHATDQWGDPASCGRSSS